MHDGHRNQSSSSSFGASFAGVTAAAFVAVFVAGVVVDDGAPFFLRAFTTFIAAFLALGVEAFFSGTKNLQHAEHSTCCGIDDSVPRDGAPPPPAAALLSPVPPLMPTRSSTERPGVSNGNEKEALDFGPELLDRCTRIIEGGRGVAPGPVVGGGWEMP